MTNDATGAERASPNEQLGLPANVLLAPIWRRIVGQIVDQTVVFLPVAVTLIAIGVRDVDDLADRAFAVNVAVITIAFVYEFVMIGQWGRTLGKFALGTRVARVDTGGPVLWYSAAIRALVPLAAGVIPGIGQILSLVVYLRAVLNPRRQGWHDRAAGTIVVMAR